MKKANVTLVAGIAVLALFATGCEKLRARDHLNKGVQAFKTYTQAVDHFKEAVQLDPEFPTARLYLATAYMSQYIPGAESPENQQCDGGRAGVPESSKIPRTPWLSVACIAALQPSSGQSTLEKMKKLDEAKNGIQTCRSRA